MGKKNESELPVIQDEMNVNTLTENAGALLEQFETLADTKNLQALTSNYLNLKQNTTYNFIFKGMGTMSGENGKTVATVELVQKDGSTVINGNTVLTTSLSKVTTLPCFVRIITKEMVKSANGQYLDMDIHVLPGTTK